MKKGLPFVIDRGSAKTLTEQIAEGLRTAILNGFYKPGDILPPTRKLADDLGVSRIVMHPAIRALSDEGLIVARPKIGSVVLKPSQKVWKGHVLLIERDYTARYYTNVVLGELRQRLISAGYVVSTVPVMRQKNGSYELATLKSALTQSVDLAILVFDAKVIEQALARSGVPFVAVGDHVSSHAQCVGSVLYRRTAFAADFIDDCRRKGVKSVLQVRTGNFMDAVPGLAEAGIRSEEWIMPGPQDCRGLEETQRDAFDRFDRRLKAGRNWLPDLIYFADDHIAVGAFAAFARHGIRIPGDLKVVCWTNRLNVPVLPYSLAQVCMDPFAHGRLIADVSLDYLHGKPFPADLSLKPVYLPGDSFS